MNDRINLLNGGIANVWTVQFGIFIIIIYMTKINYPGEFILKIK